MCCQLHHQVKTVSTQSNKSLNPNRSDAGKLKKKAEKVIVIPLGQATHFDTVIQQKGKRIGMTVYPEDLMFDP